jgi:hypothetical protein
MQPIAHQWESHSHFVAQHTLMGKCALQLSEVAYFALTN